MKEKPRVEDAEIVSSTEAPPLSPEKQQRAAEVVERDDAMEAEAAERCRLGIS